jgi:hypothetical protein
MYQEKLYYYDFRIKTKIGSSLPPSCLWEGSCLIWDVFCLLIKGPNKETFIKRKEQSKKDNPEKLATCGTQDEEKQNKNTTQYVLDTTTRKQTQTEGKGQVELGPNI